MDMVRYLRYFLVLAEELHFGRAAERLGMAQPPLSQRIRRLEREFDVELFDRSGRQVRLTQAGQLLVDEAREIVGWVEHTRLLLDSTRRGEIGTLRAGVPPDLAARVLAAIVNAFQRATPGVQLDLQEISTAEQLRMLADRQLDVGLVQHPVEAVDLTLGPHVETPLGVVLPRESPLARRSELTLANLAGHGLVLFPRAAAPGLYDATLDTCRRHAFPPVRVRHAGNPEFALGLVVAGQGVAFDQGMVAQKEARVVWRPLAGRPLVWTTSAAWPRHCPHPAAAGFGTVVAEVLRRDGTSRLADVRAEDPPLRPWSVVFNPDGPG